MEWSLDPGDRLLRSHVHQLYGGQQRYGISTPANSENILVFTDPKGGARFGYDRFEGLQEDGTYGYTGQGQTGAQVFSRGNKALIESLEQGKIIRLFYADTPYVTYVGSFTLADMPFRYEKAHDANGELRRVIVFNLLPIEVDYSAVPNALPLPTTPRILDWTLLDDSGYTYGQIDLASVTARRDEFTLQNAFAQWRRSEGHELKRLEIPVGRTMLVPDFYDQTVSEIIEAKKSPARAHVRLAIGQSLDYVHNAGRHGVIASPAILIPSLPEPDLVDLCAAHRIGLWVPEGNAFENVAA